MYNETIDVEEERFGIPQNPNTLQIVGDYGTVRTSANLVEMIEQYINQAPNHILEFDVEKVSIEKDIIHIKGDTIGVTIGGDEFRNPETLQIYHGVDWN